MHTTQIIDIAADKIAIKITNRKDVQSEDVSKKKIIREL